eukprot:Nk52_evm2s161 gene=Nk52_evmTU2s161
MTKADAHTARMLTKLPRSRQATPPESAAVCKAALDRNQKIPDDAFCTLPNANVKIPTKEGSTWFRKQYPQSHSKSKLIDDQVAGWVKKGTIIEALPGTSYNSPILAAKRVLADGSIKYRICVDYRELNKNLTPTDNFNIYRVNDLLQNLSGNTMFTTVDITACFHRYQIEQEDQQKTAFQWKGKKYQFVGSPFGIKHLPSVLTCITFTRRSLS